MRIKTLERFESVNLYSILESQLVIEIDRPVPSLDFTIAEKRAIYEFFTLKQKHESIFKV